MTATIVRIFDEKVPRPIQREPDEKQLDLFDWPLCRSLLCLPMLELHGNTFIRLMTEYRPVIVMDLRSHPYFERPALDRSIAFKTFEKHSSVYVHRAFDLRAPEDQKGLWRLRSEATDFFSADLLSKKGGGGGTIAILLHREVDVDVLTQAVRQLDEEVCWYIISPKGNR